MSTLLITGVIVFLVIELYYYIRKRADKHTHFSHPMFLKLFFTLLAIFVGFSLLYYSLYLNGHIVIVDTVHDRQINHFSDFLYFSGVTLMSVGYGDLVPVGVGRIFSLLEASLGLLLPSAFFIKAMSDKDQSN
ncbi:potassium channel LctB [Streptohalobacillus salinus]|uniref:Potassium channel LctB n=1 Tax=Streptohalobacillus salinus TaxID=621096 RepID=A0A2V3WFA3_9BACI|nr:ion channel [Streptohalobacillus salinus]PXW90905.1 potassium channel LctB [Streptohalobacillus salinus]